MQASAKLTAIKRGVAGAMAIAAGTAAYGAITVVAVPADIGPVPEDSNAPPLLPGQSFPSYLPWDIDGDTIADIGFNYRNPIDDVSGSQIFWQSNTRVLAGSSGTRIMGFRGPFPLLGYAQNLLFGTTIGPSVPEADGSGQPGAGFRADSQILLGSVYRYGSGAPNPYGGFAAGASVPVGIAGETGYLGFRIGSGPTARYGWLQLTLIPGTTAGGGAIDFISAAIGGPGEEVPAGVIPEPTSLAALVFGATAMLRRRISDANVK